MKTKTNQLSKVWIYGSGTFAIETIEQVSKLGLEIAGVLDHRNVGNRLQTNVGFFDIQSTSDVALENFASVILAVCNLHGDLHRISTILQESLESVNLLNPVDLFHLYDEKGILKNNYWLTTDFAIFERESVEIENFRNVLSDSFSLSLYDSIIKYRSSGSLEDLPVPLPLGDQYLAHDIHTPPTDLRIIDLGACQGENLEYFQSAGHTFVQGYLFEPDERNLQILTDKLTSLDLRSLNTVQAGAWSTTGILNFDSSGNPAAALSPTGENEVTVIAIDDYLPADFRPNFIKMDIEGAEMEALLGMSETIRRFQPHLAISAYHKPSDLWVIGNYLNQTYPGVYSYFLRMYGHQTFDTILYAVPLSS